MPTSLPEKPTILWEQALTSRGLGGVAATEKFVIISDRELEDTTDAFRCFEADTGKEVWSVRYPAPGQLDYGNSSRATPLIHGDLVYLFGAFGHLNCVELATGKVVWDMEIRETFGAKDERKWGMCSSPLIVEDKLIINPGAKEASLVALEPKTGKVIWKSPGSSASYGSFLAGTFGGKKQIVGYDATTLGGWEIAMGKRLWTLKPERNNDFNVPTPVQVGERLLVTTENNGTRLFGFKDGGLLDPKPLATNDDLAPDSHTPLVIGNRVFGVWGGLYCLDLKNRLKPLWLSNDFAFKSYASLIASEERVLAISQEGELLLFDANADRFKLLSRLSVFKEEKGVYSHPALLGTRLYLRGNAALICLELKKM